MPFQKKFNSAFSTTFFAPGKKDCFDFRLKEVNKILKPEGRFIFRIHETKFKKMMFHKYNESFGFEWARLVDRFIYENNPDEAYNINWWINRLKKNGFEIVNLYSYVPRLISLFYLTGFRPMFNSFMKMYAMLDTESLLELKEQWVTDLEKLLTEFIFEDNIKKLCPQDDNILYIIDAQKIKDIA